MFTRGKEFKAGFDARCFLPGSEKSLALFKGQANRLNQLIRIQRLGEKLKNAIAKRPATGIDGAMPGHDDHG